MSENNSRIQQEIKELVIARLQTLNKDSKILLMGFDKPLSVKEIVEEVKKDSSLGKKIVEVQFRYIQMLASGKI